MYEVELKVKYTTAVVARGDSSMKAEDAIWSAKKNFELENQHSMFLIEIVDAEATEVESSDIKERLAEKLIGITCHFCGGPILRGQIGGYQRDGDGSLIPCHKHCPR